MLRRENENMLNRRRSQRSIKRRERIADEPLDITVPAENLSRLLELGGDVGALKSLLGKDRPILLLAIPRIRPHVVQGLQLRAAGVKLVKEVRLMGIGLVLQQECLQQRFADTRVVRRHRHADAEFTADLGRLADNDIKHKSVHGILMAVEHHAAHFTARLSVAVNTPFALLVPRRIPDHVVMNDRVKPMLEVDALRQAVRGDKDALRTFGQLIHNRFAFSRGDFARHRPHLDALRRIPCRQMLRDILRRFNVGAEDNRMKCVPADKKLVQNLIQPCQLRIVLPLQLRGKLLKLSQLSGVLNRGEVRNIVALVIRHVAGRLFRRQARQPILKGLFRRSGRR